MAEIDGTIQSFGVLNYSGMLFNKGNVKTPFLSMIAGKTAYTNSVEFVTGQEYTSEDGEIPSISETASLTAPEASYITRAQKTNVTQIFQDAVAISYAKQSNMGTLSGVNIANQEANPINELDFQVARKLEKLGNSIEKTFINGTYNKATKDTDVNKTRGIIEAITTNVVAAGSKPLGLWMVNELFQKIADNNGDISNLTLWVDTTSLNQLNADAIENGLTISPATRNENGIQIRKLILPLGEVNIAVGKYLPAGTALLLNFDVIRPVEQPVPGKGNFFLEPLAKTGAGEKYQLFGQIGLDHGPEWYHGKITGLSTTFTAPNGTQKVEVTNTVTTKAEGAGA